VAGSEVGGALQVLMPLGRARVNKFPRFHLSTNWPGPTFKIPEIDRILEHTARALQGRDSLAEWE
jgi:hypothetical protein